MTQTQKNKETLDSTLNDTQVSDYLIENPEFFSRNPELVRDLKIPHQCDGAISLIERQTELLRQKNQRIEQQLSQLIQIGQENEAISQRLQDLSLQMIGVNNLSDLYTTLDKSLLHHFRVDAISLRLTATEDELPDTINNYDINELQEMNISTLLSDQPRCMALAPVQNDYLLGEQSSPIQSVALIPLNIHDKPGLLSLGSCDEKRFHADMDVHFLQYLAALTNKVGNGIIPA